MGASVPPEFRSQTPDRLRRLAQLYGVRLPPEVQQELLDAASEIEGSEEAFGILVADKHELQPELDRTGLLLRSAYDMYARAKMQSE
ncbi:MAG: hypothetical protein AB1704_20645 [Pseudomonadota bacterium]